jgi:hypothetical protein
MPNEPSSWRNEIAARTGRAACTGPHLAFPQLDLRSPPGLRSPPRRRHLIHGQRAQRWHQFQPGRRARRPRPTANVLWSHPKARSAVLVVGPAVRPSTWKERYLRLKTDPHCLPVALTDCAEGSWTAQPFVPNQKTKYRQPQQRIALGRQPTRSARNLVCISRQRCSTGLTRSTIRHGATARSATSPQSGSNDVTPTQQPPPESHPAGSRCGGVSHASWQSRNQE